MTPDARAEALEAVAAEARVCTRCRLAATRTNAVPGEGHPDTEVVFVGEGPGSNEDQQGRPFVGAAGTFLTELIGSVGWKREEVFITNVVKCRPPGNRDPEPDEMAACAPFLRRQLEILDPAVVVTLGRFSLQSFMPGARIGAAHGTERAVDPATGARDATAYALYHPAAAFRQSGLRETLRADMAGVPDALIRARRRRAANQAATAPIDAPPAQPAPILAQSTPALAQPTPAPAQPATPPASAAATPARPTTVPAPALGSQPPRTTGTSPAAPVIRPHEAGESDRDQMSLFR